jgi:hypothetical protein
VRQQKKRGCPQGTASFFFSIFYLDNVQERFSIEKELDDIEVLFAS